MIKNIFIAAVCLISFNVSSFADSFSPLRAKVLSGLAGCKGAIQSDELYAYVTMSGGVKVISLQSGMEESFLAIPSFVTSMRSHKGNLYVLTAENIQVWNPTNGKKLQEWPTHTEANPPFGFYERPSGFEFIKNEIYIAHGTLGVTVLNSETGAIEGPISVQSAVRDIAYAGNGKAILVIDNNAEFAFRGFGILDLVKREVVTYTNSENAFPESINVFGEKLLVGYYNAIWKYNTSDVLTSESPKVLRRAFHFPAGPGEIKSKAYFDDVNMYACYEAFSPENGKRHNEVVVYSLDSLKL